MSDLETQTYKNPKTPQMSEKRRDVEQTARAEDRDDARHNRHGHTHPGAWPGRGHSGVGPSSFCLPMRVTDLDKGTQARPVHTTRFFYRDGGSSYSNA